MAVEVWGDTQSEVECGDHGQAGPYQIGLIERAYLSYITSGQHTDAYAYVPRRKIGARSCTSLVVGSQIDKQGVIGWKHDTEAYAEHQ